MLVSVGIVAGHMGCMFTLRPIKAALSPSSEFVCLNRVAGSPKRSPHMGHINSLDGDTSG